ncbi:MAG: F0F1 ATP synthase subunit B [Clostridiales bacterium]|nr:F0F1 ATP synthase subunit B [Clostridiales bacterium]
MEELFNPVSILLHILNAAILLAALYYLLYKPVRRYMRGRAEKIERQLDDARAAKERADQALSQSQAELRGAQRSASDVVAAGARQAQAQADDIVAAARRDADAIREQARRDAEAMMASARASIVDEAASLAIDIAGKLLSREVRPDDHRRLIDEFRAKVG